MGKKKSAKNNRRVGVAPNNAHNKAQQKKPASSSAYAPLDDSYEPHSKGGKNRKNRGRKRGNSQAVYDTQLRKLLEADGTKSVIEMAADGNCLFRSLSDQLYHDFGNDHEEVRAEVCDFLEAHEDDFAAFLVLDDEEDTEEDAADFAEYVDKMRYSGEWGGNLELVIAARLYRRNITVFSTSLAAFTIEHGHANKSPAGPDLLLSYHDNDHYNSVRDNTKGKPPPPIKTFVKEDGSSGATAPTADTLSAEEDDQPNNGMAPDSPGEAAAVATDAMVKKMHQREQPRKKAPCPCGSRLRYKDCCFAKQKRNAHLQRLQEQKQQEAQVVEKTGDKEMAGEFRVLKI